MNPFGALPEVAFHLTDTKHGMALKVTLPKQCFFLAGILLNNRVLHNFQFDQGRELLAPAVFLSAITVMDTLCRTVRR